MASMKDEKRLEKLYDQLVGEAVKAESVPTPLVGLEELKKRKKLALEKCSDEMADSVVNGLLFFMALDPDNRRIEELLERYLTLDIGSMVKEGSLKSVAKALNEKNPFDLSDGDYVKLLAVADKVYGKELFTQASMMYQTLVFMAPTHLEGWLRWAQVEIEHLFDYEKDVDIYQRCLEIFQHPAVYASLGICHVKGANFGEAEVAFNKAIELCDKWDAPDLKQRTQGMLTQLKALMGT